MQKIQDSRFKTQEKCKQIGFFGLLLNSKSKFLNLQRKTQASPGFTLIELLTVIAIIALLSAIVLASLNTARQRSRDAKRVSDIKNIQLALSLYYNDNGAYPANIYTASTLSPTYITTIPTDPNYIVTTATCATTPETAGCYKYAGLNSGGGAGTGTCVAYHLGAVLEQTTSSAFNNDDDAVANGSTPIVGGYPTANTPKCSGSGNDFSGSDAAGTLTYDIHS